MLKRAGAPFMKLNGKSRKKHFFNWKENIMKTRFTFFSVLAVLFMAALAPVDAAKAVEIIKGPYLQQVTQTSIFIMWETDPAADGLVVYWPENSPQNTVTVNGPGGVEIHEIELTGLTSGSTYGYTVTSDGVTSDPNTFTTAPAENESFSFVAYGDTRTNDEAHAAVVAAIIKYSDPDIVIHTGDLVENGNDPCQWGPQFFTPACELMKNTPMFPVLGNHEASGPLFSKFFSLPNNEQWFAFTYGCVQFIALNTNVDYSPKSSQYSWLEDELIASANATWLIVYFHHPPYTRTETHNDEPAVKRHLVPLFEQYGVDMVFSGHTHAYEHYLNNGVHYIVTGGGGAPLHSLLNDKKKPIRLDGATEYHHCDIYVDVPEKSLTLWARNNSGGVIEEIKITKNGEPPTSGIMHVDDIAMDHKTKTAGPNNFIKALATVTIFDADNKPVEGATVYGSWSIATSDTDSGLTDVSGIVTLESDQVKNALSGTTFTFTVTDVTKSGGWTYDSTVEISGSFIVP